MKRVVKRVKVDEKKKNEQGITLIALVVTIVVLLILAGITINMLFSNGGIFYVANQAKIEHEIGALKDRINNVIADWSIERAIDSTVTVDDLWNKMVDADIIDNPDEDVAGPEKDGENDRYELTTNEGYIVEIIVSPDGNVSIGDIIKGDDTDDEIGGATDGLKEGNIIASEPIWSNGTASITLSKGERVAENLNIQYQVGTTSEENWTTGEEGTDSISVTGLKHNDIVYARLTDGVDFGKYASVTILDKVNPQNAQIELSGNTTNIAGSITATVTHADNESGVDIENCKWEYNTNNSEIGTEVDSYTNNFSSNEQEILLNAGTTGTYYLHVLTVDKAGNKIESISEGITITQLITNIAVSPTSVSIEQGETIQLTATITPNDASNQVVTWSSDNDNIASVNNNGLVTAKTVGTTIIRATTTDGSNKQATCNITVKTSNKVGNILKAGNYVYFYSRNNIQRKCIVLYDSSSSYGIQIITEDTLENVEIGNGTGRAQSNDTASFNTAMTSYNNAIRTLNTRAESYLNTTYASAARSVGSVPYNANNDTAGMFTSSYDYMSNYNGKLKNTDNNYLTDWNQMQKLEIQISNAEYWLASRIVNSTSSSSRFSVRYVGFTGYLHEDYLACRIYSSGEDADSYSYTKGLRVVFTLKPEVRVTGGNGTSSSPYTLGL